MKPVLVIQNVEIESPGSILNYLNDRSIQFTLVKPFAGEQLPGLDEISTIINLGCPHSMMRYREREDLVRVFNFVSGAAREDKPYLGICFGGQLLAHVLGARVEQNKVKEIGTYTVKLTSHGKADPLLKGIDDAMPVFHWHGDTFRIPDGAQLLIEGEDCKNQAFRLGRMVALQFHFEAVSREIPAWCKAYVSELIEVGKTQDEVVGDYKRVEKRVKELNYTFLDNFFSMT